MEVSIWYVVTMYFLGVVLTWSFLVELKHTDKEGMILVSLLWPAIVVVGILIGVYKMITQ